MGKQKEVKRSRSRSSSAETGRPRQKISKADSLKPIGHYLCSLLPSHGLGRSKTKLVVADMMDRMVTGGYGWDKVILYHAKVGRNIVTNIQGLTTGRRQVCQEPDSLHLHVQG